jgi:diguanylate cyclase (GGDEF)-like protein/PAS domain S-box-containing protein
MLNDNNTYKQILENMDEGVYFVDRDRRIIYWNKGAERISGFTAEQVQGHFCHENILNHVTENGTRLCFFGCPLHATIADGNSRQAEIYLHHAAGHLVPIMIRTTPLRDETGEIVGAVEVFSDNTRLMTIRHQVRRLEDAAYLDPLTGIGNRRFMEKRLQTAMVEYRYQDNPFGILFIDIDRFKLINDTYGHAVGDQVLTMVANTMRNYLRSDDAVARWGGEEFVALFQGLDESGLKSTADKLATLVRNSALRVKGQVISVTVSIGMSMVGSEDTPQTVIDRADAAMYRNKHDGKEGSNENKAAEGGNGTGA